MNYYIGIDLGTSSLKGILADVNGNILRQCSADYEVRYPKTVGRNKNPSDWIAALKKVLKRLRETARTA